MSRPTFNWELAISKRRARLARLLEMNAPNQLVDIEARLLRKAIHHRHTDSSVALRDVWWNVQYLWADFVLELEILLWRCHGLNYEAAEARALGVEVLHEEETKVVSIEERRCRTRKEIR